MYQVFIEHYEGCFAGALRRRYSFRTDSTRFLNLPGRCALYSAGRSFTWPRQVWTVNQAGALCTLLVEFLRAASGSFDHQGFAPCVQARLANSQKHIALQHGHHHDRVSFWVSNWGVNLASLSFLIPLTHFCWKTVAQGIGFGLKRASMVSCGFVALG